ncbi:helix-turn-helix transcriptional regulator [Embleya sp. NPDC005971]|uniref:helix-turn-helix domain-containing protein n=1 Tax=Embleya sp. NPDC005971 TaxID=3156724 RepID=UPI0033FE8976
MEALTSMIQARLDELGWTWAELSRRSGVPETTLSSWRRHARGAGSRGPSPDKLRLVAKALNIPVVRLFEAAGRVIHDEVPPEEEREFVEIFRSLGEDGRTMTLAAMRAYKEARRNR